MLKLVTVLTIFVAASSATPSFRHRYEENAMRINTVRQLRGGRIVGGRDTTIEDFPYQISMRFNGRHTCGGSILNERSVLSAAHCTL